MGHFKALDACDTPAMQAGGPWEVVTGSGTCTISAVPMPNGKTAIRSNGRIVAPPMAESDSESVFAIGDVLVRIRREGGGLTLLSEPIAVAVPEPQALELPEPMSGDGRIYLVAGAFAFAALFLIVKALTFLGSTAEVVSMGMEVPAEMRRTVSTTFLLRGTTRGEILAAMLLITAAVVLLRRRTWAPEFLEVTAWLVIVPRLMAVLLVDRINHVQIFATQEPVQAVQSIEELHAHDMVRMLAVIVIAGALLQLVRQLKIREVLAEE
jgi:type IV secretory pathway TrbD component